MQHLGHDYRMASCVWPCGNGVCIPTNPCHRNPGSTQVWGCSALINQETLCINPGAWLEMAVLEVNSDVKVRKCKEDAWILTTFHYILRLKDANMRSHQKHLTYCIRIQHVEMFASNWKLHLDLLLDLSVCSVSVPGQGLAQASIVFGTCNRSLKKLDPVLFTAMALSRYTRYTTGRKN